MSRKKYGVVHETVRDGIVYFSITERGERIKDMHNEFRQKMGMGRQAYSLRYRHIGKVADKNWPRQRWDIWESERFKTEAEVRDFIAKAEGERS